MTKKRNRWKSAEKKAKQALGKPSLGGPTHVQTTEAANLQARLTQGSASDLFPEVGTGSDTSRYTSILPSDKGRLGASEALALAALSGSDGPYEHTKERIKRTAPLPTRGAGGKFTPATFSGTKAAAITRVADGLVQDGRTYSWDDEIVAGKLGIAEGATLATVNPDDIAAYLDDDVVDEFRAIQLEIQMAGSNKAASMDTRARGLEIVMDAYEKARDARDATRARMDELAAERNAILTEMGLRGRATELDALCALGVR